MSHATRSKQVPVLLSLDSPPKISTKRTVTKQTVKVKSSKTKCNNIKRFKQDENLVPNIKYKESYVPNPGLNAVESRLHSKNKNSDLACVNTVLMKKSPVLQDTTNTPNKFSKVNIQGLNSNKIPVSKSEKETTIDQKLKKNTKVVVERCKNKVSVIEKKNSNTEESTMKRLVKKQKKEDNLNKGKLTKVLKRNVSKVNKISKKVELTINKNKETKEQICDKKTNLPNTNVIKTRTLRRKNISMDDIEKLLDENEQIEFSSDKVTNLKKKSVKDKETADNKKISDIKIESDKETNLKQKSDKNKETVGNKKINDIIESNEVEILKEKYEKDVESDNNKNINNIQESVINKNSKIPVLQTELLNEEKINKDKVTSKKFFKNKGIENRIEPNINLKKNPVRRMNTQKKKIIHDVTTNNDSTFILKPLKPRRSVKFTAKKLRPRKNKNYCETSRFSQSFNVSEKVLKRTTKLFNENNQKALPVYKSVISLENINKDKEEVYEFPDDSEENRKNKKPKKTVKQPPIKRVIKVKAPRILVSPWNNKQKKSIKKGSHVQFKDQNQHIINKRENIDIRNVQPYNIPEHLQNAGDSTIQEVSTIKILSNEIMEGSTRINLTVTPPIPKTITSELKLFGPRNAITSLPTSQYSNMVNHSLIRKSMSPICKLTDNFDTGSPWRATEAFSRVQRIVQSTPQLNRLPLIREKKISAHKVNLNMKSISSDDTIQVLSNIDDKSISKDKNTKDSTIINNEISPRKFGTVLSNLSPVKSNNIQNIYNKNPIKNHRSPLKIESLQTNVLQVLANKEESIVQSTVGNKENNNNSIFSSPKISVTNKSQIKSQFSLQEVNKEIKSDRESANDEKLIVLKQSNLNNFLNIDQMPEQTCIITAHGIFSDVHSTPLIEKRPNKPFKEPTIENAFGFDDLDENELSEVKDTPISITASKKDAKDKMKENVNKKVTKNSKKAMKKPALKFCLKKKKPEEKILEFFNKKDKNVASEKNVKNIENVKNSKEPQLIKKSLLDCISFSDTFDVLNKEKEIEVPDEIPLFVDLEPVHFKEPPRRSYQKRKREINFNLSVNNDTNEDSEPEEEPKPKKKKETKTNKEQRKKINQWVKDINQTFDEIDNFDLVIE